MIGRRKTCRTSFTFSFIQVAFICNAWLVSILTLLMILRAAEVSTEIPEVLNETPEVLVETPEVLTEKLLGTKDSIVYQRNGNERKSDSKILRSFEKLIQRKRNLKNRTKSEAFYVESGILVSTENSKSKGGKSKSLSTEDTEIFSKHGGKINLKEIVDGSKQEELHMVVNSKRSKTNQTTSLPSLSFPLETQIPAKLAESKDAEETTSWNGIYSDHPATQIQMPNLDGRRKVEVTCWSRNGFPLIEDKIFWSKEVENLVPKGIVDSEVRRFMEKVSSLEIQSMQPGKWNRCGRPKNHYITFQDGTTACARYRDPQNTLIQGEILSFYLSKMLGFDNVPTVILSRLNASNVQWKGKNFTQAEWTPNTIIAIIQWINDLSHEKSRVKMPPLLLSAYKIGSSLSGSSFVQNKQNSSDGDDQLADQLVALVQWTDLILFDYITGHYDRVASMQDGAERERKPSIITENIRNLRQIWQNGKLFLIDNESGLLDGYELIYRGRETGNQFFHFHRRMLNSTCLFRRQTVERIRWLYGQGHPARTLEKYAESQDWLYDTRTLSWSPELELFRTHFSKRLKDTLDWIDKCQFSRSSS